MHLASNARLNGNLYLRVLPQPPVEVTQLLFSSHNSLMYIMGKLYKLVVRHKVMLVKLLRWFVTLTGIAQSTVNKQL